MRIGTVILSFALAAAGVGLGSAAAAGDSQHDARVVSGSMLMTTDIQSGTSSFERDGATYYQTAGRRAVHTTIKGTSLLSPFGSDKHEDDVAVPGVALGGHSKIAIQAVPGQPHVATVAFDRMVVLEDGGRTIEQRITYEAEATFTRGSIDSVTSGGAFELVLTRRGQEAVDQANRSTGEAAMRRLRDQLVSELGEGTTTSEIAVDQFRVVGRTTLRGSGSTIDLVDPGLRMTLNFGLSTTG
jgi:hypothetical protein